MSDTIFPAEEMTMCFSRSGSGTDAVSAEVDARSRKNASTILHKLKAVGLGPVARAIGVNESTVSRMQEADIDRMARMLAVLGLKVVPVEMQLVDMEQVNALITLNRSYVGGLTADKLVVESA